MPRAVVAAGVISKGDFGIRGRVHEPVFRLFTPLVVLAVYFGVFSHCCDFFPCGVRWEKVVFVFVILVFQ